MILFFELFMFMITDSMWNTIAGYLLPVVVTVTIPDAILDIVIENTTPYTRSRLCLCNRRLRDLTIAVSMEHNLRLTDADLTPAPTITNKYLGVLPYVYVDRQQQVIDAYVGVFDHNDHNNASLWCRDYHLACRMRPNQLTLRTYNAVDIIVFTVGDHDVINLAMGSYARSALLRRPNMRYIGVIMCSLITRGRIADAYYFAEKIRNCRVEAIRPLIIDAIAVAAAHSHLYSSEVLAAWCKYAGAFIQHDKIEIRALATRLRADDVALIHINDKPWKHYLAGYTNELVCDDIIPALKGTLPALRSDVFAINDAIMELPRYLRSDRVPALWHKLVHGVVDTASVLVLVPPEPFWSMLVDSHQRLGHICSSYKLTASDMITMLNTSYLYTDAFARVMELLAIQNDPTPAYFAGLERAASDQDIRRASLFMSLLR